MFKYIPLEQQIALERQKSAKLKAENAKLKADLDFVAMMCDVELDNDENSETEVQNNG